MCCGAATAQSCAVCLSVVCMLSVCRCLPVCTPLHCNRAKRTPGGSHAAFAQPPPPPSPPPEPRDGQMLYSFFVLIHRLGPACFKFSRLSSMALLYTGFYSILFVFVQPYITTEVIPGDFAKFSRTLQGFANTDPRIKTQEMQR